MGSEGLVAVAVQGLGLVQGRVQEAGQGLAGVVQGRTRCGGGPTTPLERRPCWDPPCRPSPPPSVPHTPRPRLESHKERVVVGTLLE